jgi:RNA polymerase sigma-70 factor (ECF subfamily)
MSASGYREERARVGTWLARITRNRAIDALRHQRSSAGSSAFAAEGMENAADPGAPDPEELALTAIRRERLRAAVEALPEEQRRALELAFYGGLTHGEIARRLGEPLGTVKTRIREAVMRLRELLARGKI